MASLSYHRKYAQKMIGDRNVDFKFEGTQNADFHGNHFMSLKTLSTGVQESIQLRWAGLLQVERRDSHTRPRQPTPLLRDEKQRGRS